MTNKEAYVYVKPVDRPSAQNRHNYTTINGKRLNKTKAKTGVTTIFKPSIDYGTQKVKIHNWDAEMQNPYFREDEKLVQLPSSWIGSDIWKKEKITKQQYFELKHNRVPGFYTAQYTRISYPTKTETSYIQNFKYVFQDGVNILNLSIPEHEIAYEIFKASKLVANSYDDLASNSKAEFYISFVNEAEENLLSRKQARRKAASLVEEIITKYSKEKIYNFSRVVGAIKTDNISMETLELSLDKFVNDEGVDHMENIEKVIKYAALMKDKVGYEQITAEALLARLVEYRILSNFQDTYKWHAKRGTALEILGNSKQEAISFLLNPNKNDYREELEKELKLKSQ